MNLCALVSWISLALFGIGALLVVVVVVLSILGLALGVGTVLLGGPPGAAIVASVAPWAIGAAFAFGFLGMMIASVAVVLLVFTSFICSPQAGAAMSFAGMFGGGSGMGALMGDAPSRLACILGCLGPKPPCAGAGSVQPPALPCMPAPPEFPDLPPPFGSALRDLLSQRQAQARLLMLFEELKGSVEDAASKTHLDDAAAKVRAEKEHGERTMASLIGRMGAGSPFGKG
jgi:hypothetical protein